MSRVSLRLFSAFFLRDPSLRERLGEAALAKIRAYSLDRVIQEMAAIYKRYLAER